MTYGYNDEDIRATGPRDPREPRDGYSTPEQPTVRQRAARPAPASRVVSTTGRASASGRPASPDVTRTYAQPRTYVEQVPTYEYREPEPKPSRNGGGAWKGALAGGISGGVVSAALVAALLGTGVIGTPASGQTSASAPTGQAITLNTASEDVTVAEAVAKKCLPSVVAVHVTTPEGEGIGSGVILDTDGNIITNWHVAGDAKAITVTIENQTYEATLVGGDASSDVAVIKADLDGALVTPMEIGDSSELVVGDWVMTLGSPLGLDQSASSGIVSALYRNTLMPSSTGTSGNTLYTNLIQVDAAINGGNSGGALVNDKGQLVGISTLYSNAAGMESFSGIGFAIPGNYAVDIANKVINGEQVTHAYIGLSCSTVNEQNAKTYHLSVDHGAYVAEIAENGPGAKAGIETGDIITRIGDQQVASADDFILAVRTYAVGDKVDVTFVRNGEEKTVEVTLGSDEELQAQQEKEQREQEEQYQQQLEEYQQYLQQYQNQNQNPYQQQNPMSQSWPWDSFDLPW